MRLELVIAPDPVDRRRRDPGRGRQPPHAPMRAAVGRLLQCLGQHALDLVICPQGRSRPCRYVRCTAPQVHSAEVKSRAWIARGFAVLRPFTQRGGRLSAAGLLGIRVPCRTSEVKVRAEAALGAIDREANPHGRPAKDSSPESFRETYPHSRGKREQGALWPVTRVRARCGPPSVRLMPRLSPLAERGVTAGNAKGLPERGFLEG